MKDRIRQIMESEDMTPARFADTLHIGRAVISHILNGRNNPSLDVVTRILTEMPHISATWLISGSGSMYTKNETQPVEKETVNSIHAGYQHDLFSQNAIERPLLKEESKYLIDGGSKVPQNDTQNIINERITYREKSNKKISKIIIYYTDNTFETFTPE